MTKYAAFLRGIGPGNPNMRGAKLKLVAEELGFRDVQTLLSSGNILFESDITDQAKLESLLEQAWPAKLGFNSSTMLLAADPYKGRQHGNISQSYLLVTFFKTAPKTPPKHNYYDVLGVNALCSSIDNSADWRTPDFMAGLDKDYGKDQITSRTWLTVQRVLKKMQPEL